MGPSGKDRVHPAPLDGGVSPTPSRSPGRRPGFLRSHYRLLIAAAAVAVAAIGCAVSLSGDAGAAIPPNVKLSGVCPKTITLQTDWFPEAEYGVYFSLIGAKGTLDAKKGTYTGPLGKTGVNLSIRAGGPFIGQQTVQSLMYQDDSITLGLVHTDDAVRFSKQLPTVSVVAPLEHSPLALVWDPTKHTFNSWKEIGASGAKILVFTKAVNYVPYVIAKGYVPESSFDDSFDGSYSRFVADTSLLQQAFVTETPYRLKSEIKEYGRDVGVILVSRSGYDPYLSSLSVKKSRLTELTPCLKKARAARPAGADRLHQASDRDEQGDGGRRHGHEVVLDAVDAASGVRQPEGAAVQDHQQRA